MDKVLINLTPHPVRILNGSEVVLELAKPAEGTTIPRVTSATQVVDSIAGVPVRKVTFGAVEGLPPQKSGVYYLVSAMVRIAAPERQDLVSPGNLVRSADGQPVGCDGVAI